MKIPTIYNESLDALISLVKQLIEDYIDEDIYEEILSGNISNDTYDIVDAYVVDVVRRNISGATDRVLDAYLKE